MMYKKSISMSLLLISGLIGINKSLNAQSTCPSPTGVSVSPATICVGSSVTLAATIPSGTNAINWYTTATGGTPIATTSSSSTTYTPSAPGTYVFYAEAVGGGGGTSVTNYNYTGSVQSVTLQAGSYEIECWGANGYTQTAGYNGKGGYAKGTLTLASTQTVYIYVGEGGTYPTSGVSGNTWTFNGGGTGYPNNNASYGHGGGASDVRTTGGLWDDATSLSSRIIVAGGGGAGRNASYIGGNGGGLTGGTGTYFSPDQTGGPTGGSQTAGGTNTPWTGLTTATLGKAMTWDGGTLSASFLAGGGGGYYGGGSGRVAGGGGSSYIGGVTSGTTVMFGQTGFVANPIATGNNGYVRITALSNCIPGPRVATTSVIVSDFPSVNLGNDIAVCEDITPTVTLDAGNIGHSFLWNDNSTNQILNVNQSGSYSVKVTNNYGCSKSDTINVVFNPSPIVNIGNDTTICPEASFVLNAGNAGSTYLWNGNTGNMMKTVDNNGVYYVKVTDANLCSSTDTIVITHYNTPVVNLGNDTTICANTPLILDAQNNGGSYQWNTGSTTQKVSVDSTYNYIVKVTDVNGCANSDTIFVNALPSATTEGFTYIPAFFDQIGKVSFNPILPKNVHSYRWDFGDTSTSLLVTPTHIYKNSGSYDVTLTVTNNCGSNSYQQQIKLDLTSVNNLKSNEIGVDLYPNPTNTQLNIVLSEDKIKIKSIVIFNMIGQKVDMIEHVNNTMANYNVEHLSSGVYFVQILTDKGNVVSKFEVVK